MFYCPDPIGQYGKGVKIRHVHTDDKNIYQRIKTQPYKLVCILSDEEVHQRICLSDLLPFPLKSLSLKSHHSITKLNVKMTPSSRIIQRIVFGSKHEFLMSFKKSKSVLFLT